EMGSIPIVSTVQRRASGFGIQVGLLSRGAATCLVGSNPTPSAFTPMVKRISRLASNEGFRVQLLVGVLLTPLADCRLRLCAMYQRRDHPTGDGTRLEAGRAFEPCGFNSRSFRFRWWLIHAACGVKVARDPVKVIVAGSSPPMQP